MLLLAHAVYFFSVAFSIGVLVFALDKRSVNTFTSMIKMIIIL